MRRRQRRSPACWQMPQTIMSKHKLVCDVYDFSLSLSTLRGKPSATLSVESLSSDRRRVARATHQVHISSSPAPQTQLPGDESKEDVPLVPSEEDFINFSGEDDSGLF